MNSTRRPNRINIDLQYYKQAWLNYCKAYGVTPSAAFPQIVAKLTSAGGQTSLPVVVCAWNLCGMQKRTS